MKRSSSENRPENLKLVSVSPFRAVVKVDKHASQDPHSQQQDYQTSEDEEEEETEFEREGQNQHIDRNARSQQIRNDSLSLRGQREEFLGTFVEKRIYNNSTMSQYDN